MENRKLLENLPQEKQAMVLELAANARRLIDAVNSLKEFGVDVSLATLTRFVRKHREEMVLKDGEHMKENVKKLAARGQGETFRKGTIETVRQRLYEESLQIHGKEEARELYAMLVREEEKLKELELAQRKVALAEEQARVQKMRLRLELRRSGRKKVELEEGVDAPVEPARLAPPEATGKETAAVALLNEVAEILNRGGVVEEKFLEARGRICEGLGEIEQK